MIIPNIKEVDLSERKASKLFLMLGKHRLWETFLVENLNFPWNEVHDYC